MQSKDRELVHKRMVEHVRNPETTPLLVFPEGTCVNNEYTVMFKKGAFDLGATVCPVAIKYNKIFVDAFWNSRRQPFSTYIVRLQQRGAHDAHCKRPRAYWSMQCLHIVAV
jgi:glycerol-3-phosphate O-acyltransferase 3/4